MACPNLASSFQDRISAEISIKENNHETNRYFVLGLGCFCNLGLFRHLLEAQPYACSRPKRMQCRHTEWRWPVIRHNPVTTRGYDRPRGPSSGPRLGASGHQCLSHSLGGRGLHIGICEGIKKKGLTILEQFQSFGFLQPARQNQSAHHTSHRTSRESLSLFEWHTG